MATDTKLSTHDVRIALRSRYAEGVGKWVCVEEVGDTTGGANRRCDFMAMGCWRSAGLYLHGHELKISRADWQKELQDVQKADAFAKHCHYWWLVFANKAAQLEEVPVTWGVIEVLPSGVTKVRRQAPKQTPDLLPWAMLASLLRACGDQYKGQSFRDGELHKQYERGVSAGKTVLQARLDAAERNRRQAEANLAEIKRIGGQREWWSDHRMIADMKKALAFLDVNEPDWVDQARRQLGGTIDRLNKALTALEATEPTPLPFGD